MDITVKMVSFQIIQNVFKVKCTLVIDHEPLRFKMQKWKLKLEKNRFSFSNLGQVQIPSASRNILVKVYFVNTSQTVLLQITVITLGRPQILTHKTLSHLGWSHLNRAPFPNVYF